MGICFNNRINQKIVVGSKIEKIDTCLHNVCKSICKIIIPFSNSYIKGTGFLIKLYKGDNPFFFLMSNEHIINKETIELNKKIEIFYNYENEKRTIILNKNERYIKEYTDMELDITIIEIIKKDNISENYFLLPYLDYNNLENKNIYIPQFSEGNILSNSRGEILRLDKFEIIHNASTTQGSSGSPIILKDTIKVIGIHKQGSKNKNENYGNFIYPIMNIIKDDIIYKKEQYEGEYVNDKFEGKGKYIYDNGEYYIGEWKNGLRNGKGKIYNKNGNIKYEGDFVNDKAEGNGTYIWENGNYYIGDWKFGLRNGKGKNYYKNNKIMYEGDFFNDKYEGNGKYFWENGQYYIGEFKNGLSNGKGKQYYKNGKIKYDGVWNKDKYEGKGKYIWKNGEYFIGEWKNGLKNGKGKYYDKNGKTIIEGEWINDEFIS